MAPLGRLLRNRLPGNGRALPPLVPQQHKSTVADPPLSLIAFAINCRAMDDWGPERLTATQRRDLMEIVEERYGRGAT